MKLLLLNLLIAALPVVSFAQQKTTWTPQQQEAFKKEMEQFQQQMQSQVKALQDSISKLNQQLNKIDAERMESWGPSFHNNIPDMNWNFAVPPLPEMPPVPDCQEDWGKGFSDPDQWNFRFEMPPLPELPLVPDEHFQFEMPKGAMPPLHLDLHDWNFDFDMPDVPDHYYKKHNRRSEEFLEMLPFYHFFKS
jgi:hypothetical protein